MKNLKSKILICSLAVAFFACSDESYNEKYLNPSETTTVTARKL